MYVSLKRLNKFYVKNIKKRNVILVMCSVHVDLRKTKFKQPRRIGCGMKITGLFFFIYLTTSALT